MLSALFLLTEVCLAKVIIDGVEYAPVSSVSAAKIGIVITTHNRHDVLKRSLEHHLQHLPTGAVVFVVDDGSAAPVSVDDSRVTVVRNERSMGIVYSKNRSLSLLMDAGCDHLFLWDDDAYPLTNDWHVQYVESGEAHLAYQFLDLAGPRKLKDIAVIHRDSKHVAYTGQRGVMLYYKRHAIDKVGGFDSIYGRGMYEHSDLAMRIYQSGLNSWAFADVVGSNELIHSMDEHEEVERSVAMGDRQALVDRNVKVHNARRDNGYSGYAPYDVKPNVVLTSFLTCHPDPQRGIRMEAKASMLSEWSSSIKGAAAIVLADELDENPPYASRVKVDSLEGNVYFIRWLHVYNWLRSNPSVGKVFVTDGTDVVMLREPWEHMTSGSLYVGSEAKTLDDAWITSNHAASHLKAFLEANKGKTMLNAGIVGGDREDVMAFAHDIIKDYYFTISRRFWKTEPQGNEVGDMATFNYVAYTKWANKIMTGPLVHTVFKTEGVGKEYAWFRHK
jgi:hypothetical protein